MQDIVIKVENLSKQYRLGMVGTGTVASDLNRWWARLRGKEDPNLKIGEANDRTTKGKGDLVWALKDINFEVTRGEVLGIIGKNGAGKSTLLKILARTTSPSTGSVKIKGRIASLLEVGTGFHPELSGRENIYLNGAILGMRKEEIKRKFDEIVDFSGVERYIDTPVKRYSSGMYVRLAFAVAAHLEPEILIIDEVLAVGDYEFQKKCLGKMKDVSADGRTVLFVSHNMTAMKNLCSSGILLDKGLISKIGSIDEVIDHYLEDPQRNTQSRYTFKEDIKKEAQLLEIGILNAKGEFSTEVDLTKPFSLQIKYVIRESMSGLTAGFSIAQSKESEYLIVSNEAELDADRIKVRKPGYYTNTISIPEKLLNVGRYKLKVGLTAQKNIYDAVDDLIFEVIDSIGIVQSLGYDRKYSVLSVQLPWNYTKIEYSDEKRV